jgi:hypothetical protein
LRRYYSPVKGKTERIGFTNIAQGTREYGIVQGRMTLFIGVPEEFVDSVKLALHNRDHIGTHDSLCSLIEDVETCSEPENVVYLPPERWQNRVPEFSNITILTLSRFKEPLETTVGKHWWMAGGGDTELVPYLIKGRFYGTSRGKIYRRD